MNKLEKMRLYGFKPTILWPGKTKHSSKQSPLIRENARKKEEFAAKLARRMTSAEKELLKELKQLGFYPQRVVCGFIPDFWHPLKRIIVEVDGPYHAAMEQQQKDAYRDEVFRSRGYKVLRFTNQQVYNNKLAVLEEITKVVQ